MTNFEHKINAIEFEIKAKEEALKRWREKYEKYQKDKAGGKRWRADYNSCYYYLDSYNSIEKIPDCYTGKNDRHYIIGNYFETRELAERAADKIELRQYIKDKAEELEIKIQVKEEVIFENEKDVKLVTKTVEEYLDLLYWSVKN